MTVCDRGQPLISRHLTMAGSFLEDSGRTPPNLAAKSGLGISVPSGVWVVWDTLIHLGFGLCLCTEEENGGLNTAEYLC